MKLVFIAVTVTALMTLGIDSKHIELDLHNSNWTVNNLSTWTYLNNVYNILPNESLQITLIETIAKDVTCRCHYYQYEFPATVEVHDNNSVIKIPNVTDEMSTLWHCSFMKSNSSSKSIYFEISVKDAKPPQIILVNNVELPTQKENSNPDARISYYATYYYKDGDKTDVVCINPGNEKCTVELSYDYAEALDNMFKNVSSRFRVGFRAELLVKHNMSHMICTYTCPERDPTKVLVTFVLSEEFDDSSLLKIDGAIVRGMRVKNTKASNVNIYIKYAYFNSNIPLTFEYSSGKDDFALKSVCVNCFNETVDDSYIKQLVIPQNPSKIYYSANTKTMNANTIELIEIGFISLSPNLVGQNHLAIDLPKSNISIEVYKHNMKRLIYYKYNIGDVLSLKCTYHSKGMNHTTIAGKIERIVIKNATLQMDETLNNTIFKCDTTQFDKSPGNNSVVEEIRVLFRLNNLNTTSLSDITTASNTTIKKNYVPINKNLTLLSNMTTESSDRSTPSNTSTKSYKLSKIATEPDSTFNSKINSPVPSNIATQSKSSEHQLTSNTNINSSKVSNTTTEQNSTPNQNTDMLSSMTTEPQGLLMPNKTFTMNLTTPSNTTTDLNNLDTTLHTNLTSISNKHSSTNFTNFSNTSTQSNSLDTQLTPYQNTDSNMLSNMKTESNKHLTPNKTFTMNMTTPSSTITDLNKFDKILIPIGDKESLINSTELFSTTKERNTTSTSSIEPAINSTLPFNIAAVTNSNKLQNITTESNETHAPNKTVPVVLTMPPNTTRELNKLDTNLTPIWDKESPTNSAKFSNTTIKRNSTLNSNKDSSNSTTLLNTTRHSHELDTNLSPIWDKESLKNLTESSNTTTEPNATPPLNVDAAIHSSLPFNITTDTNLLDKNLTHNRNIDSSMNSTKLTNMITESNKTVTPHKTSPLVLTTLPNMTKDLNKLDKNLTPIWNKDSPTNSAKFSNTSKERNSTLNTNEDSSNSTTLLNMTTFSNGVDTNLSPIWDKELLTNSTGSSNTTTEPNATPPSNVDAAINSSLPFNITTDTNLLDKNLTQDPNIYSSMNSTKLTNMTIESTEIFTPYKTSPLVLTRPPNTTTDLHKSETNLTPIWDKESRTNSTKFFNMTIERNSILTSNEDSLNSTKLLNMTTISHGVDTNVSSIWDKESLTNSTGFSNTTTEPNATSPSNVDASINSSLPFNITTYTNVLDKNLTQNPNIDSSMNSTKLTNMTNESTEILTPNKTSPLVLTSPPNTTTDLHRLEKNLTPIWDKESRTNSTKFSNVTIERNSILTSNEDSLNSSKLLNMTTISHGVDTNVSSIWDKESLTNSTGFFNTTTEPNATSPSNVDAAINSSLPFNITTDTNVLDKNLTQNPNIDSSMNSTKLTNMTNESTEILTPNKTSPLVLTSPPNTTTDLHRLETNLTPIWDKESRTNSTKFSNVTIERNSTLTSNEDSLNSSKLLNMTTISHGVDTNVSSIWDKESLTNSTGFSNTTTEPNATSPSNVDAAINSSLPFNITTDTNVLDKNLTQNPNIDSSMNSTKLTNMTNESTEILTPNKTSPLFLTRPPNTTTDLHKLVTNLTPIWDKESCTNSTKFSNVTIERNSILTSNEDSLNSTKLLNMTTISHGVDTNVSSIWDKESLTNLTGFSNTTTEPNATSSSNVDAVINSSLPFNITTYTNVLDKNLTQNPNIDSSMNSTKLKNMTNESTEILTPNKTSHLVLTSPPNTTTDIHKLETNLTPIWDKESRTNSTKLSNVTIERNSILTSNEDSLNSTKLLNMTTISHGVDTNVSSIWDKESLTNSTGFSNTTTEPNATSPSNVDAAINSSLPFNITIDTNVLDKNLTQNPNIDSSINSTKFVNMTTEPTKTLTPITIFTMNSTTLRNTTIELNKLGPNLTLIWDKESLTNSTKFSNKNVELNSTLTSNANSAINPTILSNTSTLSNAVDTKLTPTYNKNLLKNYTKISNTDKKPNATISPKVDSITNSSTSFNTSSQSNTTLKGNLEPTLNIDSTKNFPEFSNTTVKTNPSLTINANKITNTTLLFNTSTQPNTNVTNLTPMPNHDFPTNSTEFSNTSSESNIIVHSNTNSNLIPDSTTTLKNISSNVTLTTEPSITISNLLTTISPTVMPTTTTPATTPMTTLTKLNTLLNTTTHVNITPTTTSSSLLKDIDKSLTNSTDWKAFDNSTDSNNSKDSTDSTTVFPTTTISSTTVTANMTKPIPTSPITPLTKLSNSEVSSINTYNTDSSIGYNASEETKSSDKLILIVIGLAALIVLFCIILIIYNMKKRNLLMKSGPGSNYQNVPVKHGAETPPIQVPWAFAYAHEARNPERDTKYALYARPVPRNLRRKYISENIYANQNDVQREAQVENIELNTFNVKPEIQEPANPEDMYANQVICNAIPHSSDQEPNVDLYSKVLPKDQRMDNTYVNVSKDEYYANSGNAELVQPVYGKISKNK